MSKPLLEISLFGSCIVRSAKKGQFEITGGKHKALIVLLATAPFGRRSRTFLQDTLWGISCFDSGRQSLRRALSDLRKLMGNAFDKLITTKNTEIMLDLSAVGFLSQPNDGMFLEGLNVRENSFVEWMEAQRASPDRMDFARHQSSDPGIRIVPCIAVLPFKLIIGEPHHQILGDWFAEEICRSLSRSNLLHVISHLSSRNFAREIIDISRVRSALDADYCVNGCFRIDGDNVIVDADFISVETSEILWTRRFRGPIAHFVNEAAEGLDEIVRAVGGMLASDALKFVQDREITEIDNHRLLIAGVDLMHQSTLAEFAKSKQLIAEALERAPRSAETYAWLGKWYTLCVFNGWSCDRARDTQAALDCTARALDLNPENSFCLTIDGFANNNLLQRLDIAEERYERALKSNPNEALGWLLAGTMNAFRDEAATAVNNVEKARKLSPVDPFGYFYDSLTATAYLAAKDYKKSLIYSNRSLEVNDRHLSTLRAKITSLHFLGRAEEASSAAKELLNRNPEFSIASYMKNHPAAGNPIGKDAVHALRAAGIPERGE